MKMYYLHILKSFQICMTLFLASVFLFLTKNKAFSLMEIKLK